MKPFPAQTLNDHICEVYSKAASSCSPAKAGLYSEAELSILSFHKTWKQSGVSPAQAGGGPGAVSSQQSSAPGRQYSPGPGREERCEAEKTGAPCQPAPSAPPQRATAVCGQHQQENAREAPVRAPWAAFLLWADLRPGVGQGSSIRAVCQNHLEGSGNSTAQATCHTHEVQISGGKTLASIFF